MNQKSRRYRNVWNIYLFIKHFLMQINNLNIYDNNIIQLRY